MPGSPSNPDNQASSSSSRDHSNYTRTLLSPHPHRADLLAAPPPNFPIDGPGQYGYNTDADLWSRRTSRQSAVSGISGISSNAWESGAWDFYEASLVGSTASAPGRAYNEEDELIVWPHEKEEDDYIHEADDEDEGWRRKWHNFSLRNKRGFTNVIGLASIVLGILGVFIVWPVV